MSKHKHKHKRKQNKSNATPISGHKHTGKKLIAPFNLIPNQAKTSWRDDRLPDMLWAALLITHMQRDRSLNVFRKVANYVLQQQNKEIFDITHTGLSKMPLAHHSRIISIICETKECKEILSSLLIFNELPLFDTWKAIINPEYLADIALVRDAVANSYHHQSDAATDLRWLRVICGNFSGKCNFCRDQQSFRELTEYPNYGDMGSVRPLLRASEQGLSFFISGSLGACRDTQEVAYEGCVG